MNMFKKLLFAVFCFMCSYEAICAQKVNYLAQASKGDFTFLYDMYYAENATKQLGADINVWKRKTRKTCDRCVAIAKKCFYAVANGDVSALKRLLTSECYNENFPYNDAYVRELLLGVPKSKRERLIDHVNRSEITAIPNRTGDVVTVIFTNTVTGKDFTVRLIDESGNGNWKIYEFEYY